MKVDRSKLKKLLKPSKLITPLGSKRVLDWMPDYIYVMLSYKGVFDHFPNLKNPKTFNEKLQWLKLYDHNPSYTQFVDKVKAKEIVGNIIGQNHIVPTYGVWNEVSQINYSDLPEKFVLKCNHDQGSVVLVHDKNQMDEEKISKFLSGRLKKNLYFGTREFPYKDIEPRVFAEQYLGRSIVDYKFYCFNGKPLFLYCGKGLTEDHSLKIDFFSLDWEPMPFYRTDYDRLGLIEKPENLQEMIDIAFKLSAGVPFVRIDLFDIDGKVYFSEFTLCPGSGFMPFVPEEYDEIVGEWLKLPSIEL